MPLVETTTPVKLDPVIVPAELINPAVNKLPPVTFAVTVKLLKVPTEVIVGCAAVAIVPINEAPVTLPLAEITTPK